MDHPMRSEREIVAFMTDVELGSYEAPGKNRIHSAAGAQEFGFKAALVPGVTIYGWSIPTVMDVLGDEWIDNGWAEFRLRRPTYPGDKLKAVAERLSESSCSFSVAGPDGEMRLIGTAGVEDAPWLNELARPTRLIAEPGLDEERIPLTPANVPLGEDLRPMAIDANEDAVRKLAVERLAAEHPLFSGERPRIHPAAYINLTGLIKHTYDFTPSIHVRSRVQYLRPTQSGQLITLAGRCVDTFHKGTDDYIVVDGMMIGQDQQEFAQIRHTVIFSVAKRQASSSDATASSGGER